MRIETVADALLDLMAARGIRHFFAGGTGTDFPPLVEAFAKRQAHGREWPMPVTVIHEITTVAMAHGYAMVTGEAQFAMVHTTVGTANATSGVINASRSRTPLFLAAGRAAYTEKGQASSRSHGVHWAQEARDQAGMLREYVKWDYELRLPELLETAFDRGMALAQSAPAAPVYLTLPLEVLAARADGFTFSPRPRLLPSRPTQPDDESIDLALAALARARAPLIVTTALGRDPEAVAELVRFAERLALPVVEHWHTHMNFPQDHPLHLGFDASAAIRDADVVVVLESDAPWFPRDFAPPEDATVIQIDEDPLYERYPLRGFPTDIGLQGSPRRTLRALTRAAERAGLDEAAIRARRERIAGEHRRQRCAWREAGAADGAAHPVTTRWITRCLVDCLAPDDIVVTEYEFDTRQGCFTRPGTYFNHSHAAGLGWAPGAALGAKLARPDATVVCMLGDGCHVFGVPTATHFMSRSQHLPVLFIVYNNGAWGKSRIAAREHAPDGWASRAPGMPLCELGPPMAFEKICEALGGYGERVEQAALLPAAMERALRVVREEKRQALLNICV